MARIDFTDLKHLDRTEEAEIINYVSEHNDKAHISAFGLSGTGKTEIITSSIKLLHKGDLFNHYTVLHYDASQIPEECTSDIFYNILIYKLLQKATSNDRNLTYVTKDNTFLSFLEKSTYKDEVKDNIKKTLIYSLSLLPTVGPLIYNLLNVSGESAVKDYQTNQYFFVEYLDYLGKNSGLIIFIDNIQYLLPNVISEFYELIRKLDSRILLFTSYTLNSDMKITKKFIDAHKLNNSSLALIVENITREMFNDICQQNLSEKEYVDIQSRLEEFYNFVQNGNMREIDELIFQIKQNGVASITETPILQGVKSLDSIKKDIVDLASLFPEGIKLSFIKKIVQYNQGCTETQLHQSISNLCQMKYILIGENDTLQIEHEKISQASKINLEISEEEERFVKLIHSCKKTFMDILYEPVDDGDFVFCVNGLMEFEQQFNSLKYLGVIEKYIDILYKNFQYFQICQLYRNLSHRVNDGNKIAFLFPLHSIIQILDSFQKNSSFTEGLEISYQLSLCYNMELYTAKFLLQSYHYQQAIDTIRNRLLNYESWSIYLNALQHLRQDDVVKEKMEYLLENPNLFPDIEYYYIILRNSGHLFEFDMAISNVKQSMEYFQKLQNIFVVSTCLNNIGILYLYQNQSTENISMARKYFKQAREIMSQIKSNEEYQSIINIGVTYLCQNNPELALEYFESAQSIMPESLSFDIIKLKCNILVCKYLINVQTISTIRKELLDLCSQAEELPDPWIRLLCEYNLYILRNNGIPDYLYKNYPGNINIYGLILKNSNTEKFMLGVSPHWRY